MNKKQSNYLMIDKKRLSVKIVAISLILLVLAALLYVAEILARKIIETRNHTYPSNVIEHSLSPGQRNHHIRAILDTKNLIRNKESLYYTIHDAPGLTSHEKMNALVYQGDSWMELVDSYSIPPKSLFENNKISVVINGGTSSYSPSLMEVQFEDILNQEKVSVDTVIAYIDQTDVMDEACRYDHRRVEDKDGNLLAVLRSSGADLLYNDTINVFSTLSRAYDSAIVGLLVKQIFYRGIYPNVFHQYDGVGCHWKEIASFMEGKAPTNASYIFEKNLASLIAKYRKHAKRVIILTHKHRKHMDGRYTNNVADLVKKVIKNYPGVIHYELTEVIKVYKDMSLDQIFPGDTVDPASHPHPVIFEKIIAPWVYSLASI